MATTRIPSVEGGIQPTLVTTTGDIIYASSASNPARLAIGSTNQVLGVTAGVPAYQASSKSTLTTTGDILYASGANTPARLGIGSSAQVLTVASGIPSWATPAASTPTFVGCSLYNTTAPSIANATDVLLNFNEELFDTNTFHDKVTNNGRVTIPTGYAGKYLVIYSVRSVANGTGYRTLTIYKNNVSYIQFMDQVANSAVTSYPARSVIIDLAVADYLTFYYYQTSGGALTTYTRDIEMPVQVQWLGA